MLDELIKKRKFIFFGGKGGVGKTTCACATGLYLSEVLERKTLIISTDPAHSLSDSLRQNIGPDIKKVDKCRNLFAVEIDPKKELERAREKLKSESSEFPIEELYSEDMYGYFHFPSFPGIDEAFSLKKFMEFMESNEFDSIVFDTAPTGHTLRLLELPESLSGILGVLIKVRLIFSKVISFFKREESVEEKALELLLKLKDSLGKIRDILSDKSQTGFIVVMIPEYMGIAETERLLSALYTYDIDVPAIIVNMVMPRNDKCDFCKQRYKLHKEYLDKIKDIYSEDYSIFSIPLFPFEINGIDRLKKIWDYLFS